MRNWRDTVVSADTPLRETLANLSRTGAQIALVLDNSGKLQGVVTDGDVRKAILAGIEVDSPTQLAMNVSPKTASLGLSQLEMQQFMTLRGLRHLPIVDDSNAVVGLALLDELGAPSNRTNPVVIMAGGLGTRLHPLTKSTPKPMLTVGGKPILETIVGQFAQQGFSRIFLAVNHLSETITSHFGDGTRYGVEISYLQEDTRLGTAGALFLLPSEIESPIIVMNGDLLTQLSFESLLRFHEERNADLTMVVRENSFQIPYGVVAVEGSRIVGIDEKPSRKLLVNAGIYVVSARTLALIPQGSYFDMPALFAAAISAERSVEAFPLHEYWIDIGRVEELERAQREWVEYRS
jgi:dTDP-glucose pyrophosphorylase